MKNLKYLLLSAVLMVFMACSDDDNDSSQNQPLPELTAGTADFSNFVAMGNSLTAGFTDGALFIASQENSLPNILSDKFALVGGGPFTQPLMNDNFGGLALAGNRIFSPRLVTTGGSPLPLESVIGAVTVTTDIAVNNPSGPFNNLGIPGAKSFHLLAPGYGNITNLPSAANPYAVRVTDNTPNASMLELAMAQSPSFFSLWIGNNDVLGYALSGGESNPDSIDYDPITPLAGPPGVGFTESYGALVATLTSGGAQGVLTNIPNVTSIPHFTSVVWNQLDPNDENIGPLLIPQIPALNAQLYGPLNGIFTALGEPDRINLLSDTEANPLLIFDENATDRSAEIAGALTPVLGAETAAAFGAVFGKARQATASDLVVLPAASIIATPQPGVPAPININGISFPLQDKWVLLPAEQAEITAATTSFNATITAAADQAGLALLDANGILNQLASGGIATGNFILTSDLVLGGAFSLDGIHPTARGYALLANEVMKAIDETYGSNFEASGNLLNVGNYPTNYSPALQ